MREAGRVPRRAQILGAAVLACGLLLTGCTAEEVEPPVPDGDIAVDRSAEEPAPTQRDPDLDRVAYPYDGVPGLGGYTNRAQRRDVAFVLYEVYIRERVTSACMQRSDWSYRPRTPGPASLVKYLPKRFVSGPSRRSNAQRANRRYRQSLSADERGAYARALDGVNGCRAQAFEQLPGIRSIREDIQLQFAGLRGQELANAQRTALSGNAKAARHREKYRYYTDTILRDQNFHRAVGVRRR